MNILVVGEKPRAEEMKQKLPQHSKSTFAAEPEGQNLASFDLIIDLNFDDNPANLQQYASLKDKPIIACAVKRQLAEIVFSCGKNISCRLIGINALPSFISRSKTEISLLDENDKKTADEIFRQLNWDYLVVEDRVGMVTPRIIFMIINEACYTLQERTAGIRDIDLGMKLGTNYPYGPFEWADKIGIKEVYETLLALYQDTRDERYKICPLLKTKYLKEEKFYS